MTMYSCTYYTDITGKLECMIVANTVVHGATIK